MDANNIAILLTAIGGPTTIVALYKWAKAQGRAEEIQVQSAATILALKNEKAELKKELDDEKRGNQILLEALTRPGGAP